MDGATYVHPLKVDQRSSATMFFPHLIAGPILHHAEMMPQFGRASTYRLQADARFTYRFTVLDSPIVNAFALPGGYVYVTRGIMTHLESEAELASVIGHEIGHVTARHGAQRATRQQQAGLGVLAATVLGAVLESRGYGGATDLASQVSQVAAAGFDLLHASLGGPAELVADEGNEALDACGYPLCKGNVMASNPDCCLTPAEWAQRFERWM